MKSPKEKALDASGFVLGNNLERSHGRRKQRCLLSGGTWLFSSDNWKIATWKITEHFNVHSGMEAVSCCFCPAVVNSLTSPVCPFHPPARCNFIEDHSECSPCHVVWICETLHLLLASRFLFLMSSLNYSRNQQ